MGTAEPRVSILLAVYHPRMDWLRLQLDSLNAQTWPNLELLICDDGPDEPVDEAVFREHVTAFPWRLLRNEENLGSNRTFEKLTLLAEGDYLCYCDQDDIWLPGKTARLLETLCAEKAGLVCSDMYIIDGAGKRIADSITKIRRHHIFRSGTGLTDTLWYSNFASGCALLADAALAKAAVPFNPHMYYDHYVTLFAANAGRVISLREPLLYHREHGGNQSSTLQGVHDRESYYRIRVETPLKAVCWLCERFPADEKLRETLEQGKEWLEARLAYGKGERKRRGTVWEYRRFSPMASLFELLLPYMPAPLMKLSFWLSRKNLI